MILGPVGINSVTTSPSVMTDSVTVAGLGNLFTVSIESLSLSSGISNSFYKNDDLFYKIHNYNLFTSILLTATNISVISNKETTVNSIKNSLIKENKIREHFSW